jgi:hypothetical protein
MGAFFVLPPSLAPLIEVARAGDEWYNIAIRYITKPEYTN